MSYIVHYGVKGMQKGKRRWTNADGSLNEAGKARYSIPAANDTSPGYVQPYTKRAREWFGKAIIQNQAVFGKNKTTLRKKIDPDAKKKHSGEGNETFRKRNKKFGSKYQVSDATAEKAAAVMGEKRRKARKKRKQAKDFVNSILNAYKR